MIITYNGNPIGTTKYHPILTMNFSQNQTVQDEVRGYLQYVNMQWCFVGTYQTTQITSVQKIALVLESPHKHEYSSSLVPLRPANGKTGTRINHLLAIRSNLTRHLNVKLTYEVLLMNAIQYQCSCHNILMGHAFSCTRDHTINVFRMLFNKKKGNLRIDFINRLSSYAPDIVFNCSGSLEIVETAIKYYVKNLALARKVIMCNDIHPSRW